MALETEGYVVVEADSAAKALELMAESRFDLATLDMRMPEMGGLELLAEMRKRSVSTPVIIITAYGDVPLAVRAMKLGAIDFSAKTAHAGSAPDGRLRNPDAARARACNT